MQSITVAEAAQKLPDLIDAVIRGEEVVIIKDDHSVVKLVPASPVKLYPAKAGSAKVKFGCLRILMSHWKSLKNTCNETIIS